MKKCVLLVLSIVGIVALSSAIVQATVVEYELPDPFAYEREIGPEEILSHSAIELYVENILDPERFKEWEIIIWIPVVDPDLTWIQVDYSNDPHHVVELERFDVPLDPYTGSINLGEDWKGFYANTWCSKWDEFGTNPVGSGLPHEWGNPRWVSFHFEANADPWIYIKDACLPEPTTIALFGLGALSLLRRRR